MDRVPNDGQICQESVSLSGLSHLLHPGEQPLYGMRALTLSLTISLFSSLNTESTPSSIRNAVGASLVAQWLRICLPMQGTRVRALVWEDPTCRGAARPVSHNY
ncbi:hypothetical protein J1605_019003 [Eschrichtius robustus]|uniref:Uncharacterized protein n=1 Tax=Eschrichtius robustus TaxID=9764 RepID=A0AB34HRN9_ESCRO|nr:hypothetical protein J1605_019003 [Eschrichtius robustus]